MGGVGNGVSECIYYESKNFFFSCFFTLEGVGGGGVE